MFKDMGPSVGQQWKLCVTIAQMLCMCSYQGDQKGNREEYRASSLGFVIYYFIMCLSIIVLLLTFVKPSTVLLYCQTALTKLDVILQVQDNLLRYLLFNCSCDSNVESIFYLGEAMFCLWIWKKKQEPKCLLLTKLRKQMFTTHHAGL